MRAWEKRSLPYARVGISPAGSRSLPHHARTRRDGDPGCAHACKAAQAVSQRSAAVGMSNPSFTGEDSTGAPVLPERPSLRARIITWLVRLVIKRWPRGDYEKLVHRARLVFGLPTWMSWL